MIIDNASKTKSRKQNNQEPQWLYWMQILKKVDNGNWEDFRKQKKIQ